MMNILSPTNSPVDSHPPEPAGPVIVPASVVVLPLAVRRIHVSAEFRSVLDAAAKTGRPILLDLPDPAAAESLAGSVLSLVHLVTSPQPDGSDCVAIVRGVSRARRPLGNLTHAPVQVLRDLYPDSPALARATQRQHLLDALRNRVTVSADLANSTSWLETHLSLGQLGDVVAQAAQLAESQLRALLEELNVDRRIQRLLDCLECAAAGSERFPPDFSRN